MSYEHVIVDHVFNKNGIIYYQSAYQAIDKPLDGLQAAKSNVFRIIVTKFS